jgi:polar amino acid transport system substrate-binding protein
MRTVRRVLAAAVAALLTQLPAEAQQLPAGATQRPGVIQFAADFAAAPNQFLTPDGRRDGLNVDMCGEIGRRLGAQVEWTNLAFPGLVPGLQARRFDALCTAIFITPERKQVMNMVAYVQWGEGLMVAVGNRLGVNCRPDRANDASFDACFEPLAGRTVSVAAGGTTNRNLQAQSDRLRAAGRQPITIRAFDTNADAIQALVSRQVDAAYLNDPQAYFYINRNPGRYEMAFEGHRSNQLALATLRDNLPLAEAFQRALTAMRADGTYQQILQKWGVAAVPEFALNP